ncbi:MULTISPECIES: hypothetical protein [Photorhabdus]|uniref:Uncharacterized protein n=1 Tax=Photorhabdus bodei TaxID=2029681 RepID=A0AAW6BDP3_9GAMM|nr:MULTISPECIES: hypothetical protein [Photorhabdus]MCT8352430.1 hypothetical protein [Photorhabdus kayaii]MDB6370675.1 hypothetical protein [Photorhabdus bodei]
MIEVPQWIVLVWSDSYRFFMLVTVRFGLSYTLWISRCIAMARERIPGSIANFVINKYIYIICK